MKRDTEILRSKNYMHHYESTHVVTQVKKVEVKAKEVKAKKETHGKCWSKFGTMNADPASPVHTSIPNWGMKIKLRADQ